MRKPAPDLTPVGALMNPSLCPAHLLGWLAWAFSVDEWDVEAPEEVKREVIRQSIEVHRRKGTVGAVKRALAATGVPSEITEWWQDGADPHTFKIHVDIEALIARGMAFNNALLADVRRGINATKPVRSHYSIVAFYSRTATVHCGAVLVIKSIVEVYP